MHYSLWTDFGLPLPFCCYFAAGKARKNSVAFYYKHGVMPSLRKTLPDRAKQANLRRHFTKT